jgi:hypothetical protein
LRELDGGEEAGHDVAWEKERGPDCGCLVAAVENNVESGQSREQ